MKRKRLGSLTGTLDIVGFPAGSGRQRVKNLPAMLEIWIQFLGWEDPLEKRTATHSCILAWRIPWQRSLAGYSPWGHKELDMTQWLSLSLFTWHCRDLGKEEYIRGGLCTQRCPLLLVPGINLGKSREGGVCHYIPQMLWPNRNLQFSSYW